MVLKLPPPVKVKSKYALNTSGVVGVTLTNETSRNGTATDRYVVSIPLANGRRGKRSFSLAKYGRQKAFDLAVAARKRAVASFIETSRRSVKP